MFVTGFTDAEGSFMLKLNQKVQLEFCIGLHVRDLRLLMSIKEFFGVGNVNVRGNVCYYSVTNLHDILNVIIPLPFRALLHILYVVKNMETLCYSNNLLGL